MNKPLWAALLVAGISSLTAIADEPVSRVPVPPPGDPKAYEPVPAHKPLPPEGFIPGQQPPAPPPEPGPAAAVPGGVAPNPSIRNEDAFLQSYDKRRSPRIMVWVNRSILGDPLPKDGLEELIRVEEKQAATGAVNVSSDKSVTGSSNTAVASGGYGGASTGTQTVNVDKADKTSFNSGGPAEYTKTTSVKVAPDKYDAIGATPQDYDLIEASVVKYFDNSGKVMIRDSEAARGKLDREKILRIENGDPAASRLLSTELQQDVLIRITAKPTHHAQYGDAVRLIAKATSTTDARILGTAFVDMPLPLSKTNVNIFTRYLSEELMGEMAKKWLAPAEYDPIEIRIYKVAAVDDGLKIRKWIQQIKGVSKVNTISSTGSSVTAYSAFGAAYSGAPEDLYADLKDAIGASQGLKAVDLTNNTISLEMTGPLNLVTTTRATEVKTTTETKTTETKTVEPINPANPQ